MQQDPWECLFSFICSANNNIKRITGMINNAAQWAHKTNPPSTSLPLYVPPEHRDKPNATEFGIQYYWLQGPSTFAAENAATQLRNLGFGYRADYIQKTAKTLCDLHGDNDGSAAYLRSLRESTNEDYVREQLLQFAGVGPKVADCVMLMSLDFVRITTELKIISLTLLG